MIQSIHIGNQTAISCTTPMEPFEFALRHGFDAFEWFADKKWDADGIAHGWEEPDIDAATRAWIRESGERHGITYTVHAPWQSNPLHADGVEHLRRSIDFARDIGAGLVNLHLYMDNGAEGYARALEPVIRHAGLNGIRLSIENTPHTTPDDFNATFVCIREWDLAPPGAVGMCLDIGHANLCLATHNDYIGYIDQLAPAIPLIHLHAHENYGDADSHLTLFTGPARENDAGIRALVSRLRQRRFQGAIILEQWPDPPSLLVDAATRLRELLNAP
jgi:sugar phosphate isomerase/epimerase